MRVLIALVIVGLSPAAIAASFAGLGWGDLSCPEAIKQLRAEPTFVEWAKGYMSGINIVRLGDNGEFHDLGGLTNTGLAAQLADICEGQPEISAQEAVNHIYRSLPLRKTQ